MLDDSIPLPGPYAYWHAALAGILGPVQDGNPQQGFYRLRRHKDAPWLPVAIWRDEAGALQCMIGDAIAPVDETWLRCARHSVPEDAYRLAVETGKWPGELDDLPPAGIGDNMAPADPAEAATAVIDDTVAEAKAWLDGRRIEAQADADRAEALIARLARATKEAEAQHKAQKAPHLEAGRAVDARWKPLIDNATGAVRMLKAALTPFLTAREAEKREAAAKAIAGGAEVARADMRATTSGTGGRKVSLRTRRRAVIKDYAATLQFFADNPEVRHLVQSLADKVAGIGGTVPGVEIVTEQVAA